MKSKRRFQGWVDLVIMRVLAVCTAGLAVQAIENQPSGHWAARAAFLLLCPLLCLCGGYFTRPQPPFLGTPVTPATLFMRVLVKPFYL